jgi:hypothetical protein
MPDIVSSLTPEPNVEEKADSKMEVDEEPPSQKSGTYIHT